MQTPEQHLDKQIMLWCGQHNWLCFHCNVGKVLLADGRYFSTGLPNGFPDLLIITDFGVSFYCETKIKPRKPSNEQKEFINNLIDRNHVAFVAYTFDEFISAVNSYIFNNNKPLKFIL